MRVGMLSPGGRAMRGVLGAGLLMAVTGATSAAQAQASANCSDIQAILVQRKSIADSLSVGKGKKIDAKFACSRFGALVSNGERLIKWTDANKDWCQVPDSFVSGIKADHQKAIGIRSKACGVAAKMEQMEKQAKQGGGGGGLLGGNGLSGDMRMPQGAL